jgi:hypothetical protein
MNVLPWRLHLITLPTSSLQAELLIGAGCVETLDTSGVSLAFRNLDVGAKA